MELRIIISDRYNQKYCMSKREPHLLIKDIIDSAQKILEYTSGISFDDFSRDSKTIDAVIRNFEILEKLRTGFPINSKINIQQLIG
jgi:hypothetical protein